MKDFRRRKDALFTTSDRSPIPSNQRRRFSGLVYFEVDPRYRLHVEPPAIVPLDSQPVYLDTSDGGVRVAQRAGRIAFILDGRALELAAFRINGGATLFVPFRDATSGRKTYAAGRYLDIELEPDGSLVLDFNLAYHPYCAYSPSYSCPLPPPENELPVRIEAGERLPDRPTAERAAVSGERREMRTGSARAAARSRRGAGPP